MMMGDEEMQRTPLMRVEFNCVRGDWGLSNGFYFFLFFFSFCLFQAENLWWLGEKCFSLSLLLFISIKNTTPSVPKL